VIQHEPGVIAPDVMATLAERGHRFKDVGRQYGNMQAILIDKQTGKISAAADPRGIGSANVMSQP